MDFEQRLEKAIERGTRRRDASKRETAEQALSDEDYKRLHMRLRVELSDYLETCVGRLADHFPGFRYQTVSGDRGLGAAVSRDDMAAARGRRNNLFSRLEMVVRPASSYHLLELTAKGTVHNKEVYDRKHFQKVDEVDLETYHELIDLWVLEYAELYAAAG